MEKAFQNIRDINGLTRQQLEAVCTKHVQSVYLGDHKLLCKILGRYKIYLDSRDVGVVPNILLDGYWESWITHFITSQVKEGDVCIDVGANFGYYSLLLAELAGRDGKAIAIEPNAELARLLGFTSSVNEYHFDVVHKALSDSAGTATLRVPLNFWGGGSIRDEKVDDEELLQKVATISLDELVLQKGLQKVDFIKMDCEGAEPMIFKGMEAVLRNNPQLKIVMEYSPFMYRDARSFTQFLFSRFDVRTITGDVTTNGHTADDLDSLLALTDHIDLYLGPRS